MKRSSFAIPLTALIYSYLFYQESPGINFLLFTLILLTGLIRERREVLKKTPALILMGGSILSATGIFITGSPLAVLANLFSLVLLSVLAIGNLSLITGSIHAGFSYLLSWYRILTDLLDRPPVKEKPEADPVTGKFLIIGIPLIVTGLFFILYRSSNAVFYNYTKHWNLDFLSFGWLFFTLGGFLLAYGFYRPRLLHMLLTYETSLKSNISVSAGESSFFGKTVHISTEYLSGTVLLVLLNLLIFLVNMLDAGFLFFNTGPSDASYSEAVHQGIGTLIFSIIMAISVILVYLRGRLNFYRSRGFLYLAYGWILQNILLVMSTAYKNGLYISEYGLTYKRIGVYIYLLLAAIGLVLTCIKIARVKTAWYLINTNAWAMYVVWIAISLWNWDALITSYNMRWAREKDRHIDLGYLVSLSDNNLPQLNRINEELHAYRLAETEKENFSKRVERMNSVFKLKYRYSNWKSLTWNDLHTHKTVSQK
jgi:hypothetical protein